MCDEPQLSKLTRNSLLQDMVEELTRAGFVEGLKTTAATAYIALQRCVMSSLKVLTSKDRLSLAQLTIFPSTFDIAAASAVLGLEEFVTKQQLRQLRQRSLVTADTPQVAQQTQQQYELHLFIRDMALSGFEQNLHYLQAQKRFLQYFASVLHSHKHRHTPEGVASMRRLVVQRHSLVRFFALLAAQQQPLPADAITACCQLGQPGLAAVWLLRLDMTVVCSALANLLKWARACNLPDSIIAAQAQLGFMLSYDAKQIDCAEGESQAALDAARQQYGQDDAHMVMPLMTLGDVMNDKVNAALVDEYTGYKKGRGYYEQAHKIMVKTKGKSHPETLACEMAICDFMHSSQEKIQLLRQILGTAQRELHPSNHPTVVNVRSALGEALSGASNSQLIESIPLLREDLSHCQQLLGFNERLVPDAMLRLGNALVLSKQPAKQQEGLQLIEQAIDIMSNIPDSIKDVIIARQETLAPALLELQQVDAAIQILKSSLQMCEQECKEDSRIVQIGLRHLADAYSTAGNHVAAAEELAKAHAKILKNAATDTGGSSKALYVARTGIMCDIAINLELQGRSVPFLHAT